MGELYEQARTLRTTTELCALFSRYIAADGFTAHALFSARAGMVSVLLSSGCPDAVRDSDGIILGTESWSGESLYLKLIGRGVTIDAATQARMQGAAEVYATYAAALLECAADTATSAGLGLAQRLCLTHRLLGDSDLEIAAKLNISPIAVRNHFADAVERLHAQSLTEAVAIAARRGWLAGLQVAEDGLFAFSNIHS